MELSVNERELLGGGMTLFLPYHTIIIFSTLLMSGLPGHVTG